MNNVSPILFSGSSNEPLAEKIASWLNISIGDVYQHKFPSGECYCQLKENVRNKDVFIVQSLTYPVNDNLMELLVMADACRRANAKSINAIIPYFGYARQDRLDKPGVPISAKLVMDILSASGINRIITMDLHAPQIAGFTNLLFDNLSFKDVLIPFLESRKIDVIVAPDVGAVKRAEMYASEMKKDLAIISKKRNGDTDVSVRHFIGEVKDKNILIVDDLTESCGTLIEAAKACKEHGAKFVTCAVTHPCLSEVGQQRLGDAICPNLNDITYIDEFIQSNTISYKWYLHNIGFDRPTQIIELSAAPIFALCIKNSIN